MSLADWQAALSEVEGRRDLGGVIGFPGTSLLDDGRSRALRSMVDALEPQ